MNFESTVTRQSLAFPEVSYSLRKMTRGRRVKFDLAMADQLAKLRSIGEERELLEEDLKPHREKAKAGPCTCAHGEDKHDPSSFVCLEEGCKCRMPDFPPALYKQLVDLVNKELTVTRNEIQPALIRWGVASITGLDIDGKPATPETLVESGPETLCTEIAGAVSEVMQLSDIERKNFDSPTTSGELVAGATLITNAHAANSGVSTSTAPVATAASSSLPSSS